MPLSIFSRNGFLRLCPVPEKPHSFFVSPATYGNHIDKRGLATVLETHEGELHFSLEGGACQAFKKESFCELLLHSSADMGIMLERNMTRPAMCLLCVGRDNVRENNDDAFDCSYGVMLCIP